MRGGGSYSVFPELVWEGGGKKKYLGRMMQFYQIIKGAKGADANRPLSSAPYFNYKSANQALNMVPFLMLCFGTNVT